MKKVKVHLKESSYEVLIGRNLLKRTGLFLRRLRVGSRVMVVANRDIVAQTPFLKIVRKSLLDSGFRYSFHELKHGTERDKSEAGLSELWKSMTRAELDRKSTLIALGGGVTGDLAAFAASTYMRGINLVQIPTTLLAQVDSAIGGKTAIDLAGAKNVVGTFYQPRLVISDIDTLGRLPLSVFKGSFSEVVKYGVIRDPVLFKMLEEYGKIFLTHVKKKTLSHLDFQFLEQVVYRCVKIKASVVQHDEKEKTGERMILNYGHTFAHVLEAASGYKMTHGEAVGLGMMLAACFARDAGLTGEEFVKRQSALIRDLCPSASLGPHVRRYRLTWEKMRPLFAHDKKAFQGKVRFVLPMKIGQVKIVSVRKSDWPLIRTVFRMLGL